MTPETPADKESITGQALVLFDGQCRLCQKSVAWLKRLDWLGRLAYQDAHDVERIPATDPPLEPQRLLEAMHLLTPDGRHVYHGFAAFRWMAWRLQLLWIAAPLLYLPGMPWLGQHVYRWVARNRYSLVPCHDGVCQVPVQARSSEQKVASAGAEERSQN